MVGRLLPVELTVLIVVQSHRWFSEAEKKGVNITYRSLIIVFATNDNPYFPLSMSSCVAEIF